MASIVEYSSRLVERAQQVVAQGRQPIPARGKALLNKDEDFRQPYALEDFAHPRATDVQIVLGVQSVTGRRLTLVDLDSHHEGQNADAAREAFERDRPELAALFDWRRSQNNGWHGFVESYKEIPPGKLFDSDGRHIGEIVTTRTLDPGDIRPGILNQSQVEQLGAYWTFGGNKHTGEQWRARAAEGRKYAYTWTRYPSTKPTLIAFLRNHCGTVGGHLAELFSTRKGFDRSEASGALMQCLMFNIHKEAPNASYSERCAHAMAYWMAADSYGKASEKDYNQELDGYATIAKILNEAPKQCGGQWRAPFWAKSHPTPPRDAPALAAEPASRRPAHRPAGDRDRMLGKIRRYFELRAFESDGKIYYQVADLAERFSLAPRTMQTYLHDLEHTLKLFTRGQDPGPGGRAWLIWGADNSENQPQNDADDAPIWGADASAIERVPAQETADRTPQCKEDHQNPCAPAALARPAMTTATPTAAPGGPAGPAHSGDLPSAPAGAHPAGGAGSGQLQPAARFIGSSGMWSEGAWCDPTAERDALTFELAPDAAQWDMAAAFADGFLCELAKQPCRYGARAYSAAVQAGEAAEQRKRVGALPTRAAYRERARIQEEVPQEPRRQIEQALL